MTPSAALALACEPPMIVQSDLLGPLTVEPDKLIDFPAGIFGFPECRSFAMISTEREGVYWLQSADHSTLSFLLIDPFLFFDDYAVDVSTADLRELDAVDFADVVILAIVTLPRTRQEQPTANLQGPLAINLRTRAAKQLALAESEFGVRCAFDLSSPAATG